MTTRAERTAAKRRALLAAAADLIIERGYDDASLDAVVERARCSKSAVYELFGNKEGLLNALTEELIDELAAEFESFDAEGLDARSVLCKIGRLGLEQALNDRHIAIARATIAATWRHPDIGERYFEVHALRMRTRLARFLAERSAAGELVIDDYERAAREFQSLLFYERFVARVTGAAAAPSEAEIETLTRRAVDAFLALYGASH